jgi:hypothetical protein
MGCGIPAVGHCASFAQSSSVSTTGVNHALRKQSLGLIGKSTNSKKLAVNMKTRMDRQRARNEMDKTRH